MATAASERAPRARPRTGRRGFAAPALTAGGGEGPREARAKRAGLVEGVLGAEGRKPLPRAPKARSLRAGFALESVAGQRGRQVPHRAWHLVTIGDHVVEGGHDPV